MDYYLFIKELPIILTRPGLLDTPGVGGAGAGAGATGVTDPVQVATQNVTETKALYDRLAGEDTTGLDQDGLKQHESDTRKAFDAWNEAKDTLATAELAAANPPPPPDPPLPDPTPAATPTPTRNAGTGARASTASRARAGGAPLATGGTSATAQPAPPPQTAAAQSIATAEARERNSTPGGEDPNPIRKFSKRFARHCQG